MLIIVIGLALADFVTGWIKAYCKGDVRSSKMRKGGLNKLAEIVVMGVAIGSEIGYAEWNIIYDSLWRNKFFNYRKVTIEEEQV